MRKIILILTTLFIIVTSNGQKKEKINGSKIITIEKKEIADFDTLEVEDNIEVFLVKGKKCGLEIDADDNLHEIISLDLNGMVLRIRTLRNVTSAKKLSVRIIYDDKFKMVTSRNEASINVLEDIDLAEISFKSYDFSKLFIKAKVKIFNLKLDDKSKAELSLKTENAVIELSKNSFLKATIESSNLECQLYQKANAEIEGKIIDMKLKLDSSLYFSGKKLLVTNLELVSEGNSQCSVNVSTNLAITASGNSEIEIYGDAKIEVKRFTDNAKILKKPLK